LAGLLLPKDKEDRGMSNFRQSNGDDYPDASRKNLEDSKILLEANRYDGAGYLAGYSIECIIKTIALVEGTTLRRHGHNLNNLKTETIHILSFPSCRTAKYISNSAITSLSYGSNPNDWEETIRYQGEGRVSGPVANTWIQEAQRLYKEVISQMILDRVII
jgi:hypothetical protein